MGNQHGTPALVSASVIEVVEGHNPRGAFHEDELQELQDAVVAADGIDTPLLVRPKPGVEGVYQLVAGERRLRVSIRAFGSEVILPVLIKELSDVEMAVAALNENIKRAAMSPADEARAAHRVLMAAKGDRAEAAAQLGWTTSMLSRRLALMQAVTEVLMALTKREIELGHAELLAALPKDKQLTVLTNVLAQKVPVGELKRQIANFAHELSAAVFDTADCGKCEFNSAMQVKMFSEALDCGNCTNPTCFKAKEQAWLEAKAESLRSEVQRVEIIRAEAPVSVIKIHAEGPTGVGGEQAQACTGCANYGMTISGIAGEVGSVEDTLCFDGACHAGKVAAMVTATKKAAKAAKAAPTPAAGGSAAPQTKASAKPNAPASAVQPKAQPVKQAKAGAVSSRIHEYRLKVWRDAAKRFAVSSEAVSRDTLVALAAANLLRHVDSTVVSKGLASLAGLEFSSLDKMTSHAPGISSMGADAKGRIINSLAACAMEKLPESNLRDALSFMGVPLGRYWKVNAEFLNLLTKSEAQDVAVQIGLAAHIGNDTLRKLSEGKKDAFVAGLMNVTDFSFEGKVPACMLWSADDSGGSDVEPAEGDGDDGDDIAPSQSNPEAGKEQDDCEPSDEEVALG